MSFPAANFTTPADWIPYASTVTSGLFWDLILVAIFVVAFGTLSGSTSTERAFASTSFLNGILAAFLFIMGGIDTIAVIVSIALTIGSFMLLLFSKD